MAKVLSNKKRSLVVSQSLDVIR